MKIKISIALAIAAFMVLCGFSCHSSYKYQSNRKKVSEYHEFSRTPFLASLDETFPGHHPEKIKYWGMHFLLKERNSMPEADSIDAALFDQLEKLDIRRNRDSIEAVFRTAFRYLDLEPGPPNDFIEEEMSRRVSCIIKYRCFHPGQLEPFDQLGKDILRIGVPDLEEFGTTTLSLFFPQIGLARHYKWSESEFYVAQAPMIEVPDPKLPGATRLIPDYRYLRGGATLPQQEMELIKDKIYQMTPYARLKNAIIKPFLIPVPQEYEETGPQDYFYLNWSGYRAGIDVFYMVKDGYADDDSSVINITVRYVIYNPLTNDIIDSASMLVDRSIDNNEYGRTLNFRIFSEIFHNRTSLQPGNEKSYLLDIDVSTNDSADKIKKLSASNVYRLPEDIIRIPDYEMSIVSGYPEYNSEEDILRSKIPLFNPGSLLHNEDTITVWFPITDLRYKAASNAYEGIIDYYLIKESNKHGAVRIVKESIEYSPHFDSLKKVDESDKDLALEFHNPEPVKTDTIISNAPNIFHTTSLVIPESIKENDYYTLIAFVYCLNQKNRNTELISTATCKIEVR